ncbi:hypothetical protein EVC45_42405 [Paraburkholderia sp. UYCP14C]|uniref:hypothetical protein n=1 Tax=Paraburkholderia sp. UYCP14C TaxID=2511130 RepID=UPI001021EA90|nr:hypothetical protein [Paraburkholderia sp. UYCP14C]RZF23772.1 hypothetical protein EVC45_42405 [Paraburkholderia sp. UYCP14C]
MPRPADPQRFDAMNHIRRYVLEHGEQEGQRLAKLAGYRHVNKATWSQWCKRVREEDRQLEADVILNVPHPGVPAGQAPPFTPITPATPEQRVAVRRALDFFRELNTMADDAQLLRDYSVAVDSATGVRKVKNPVMLAQSHKMRGVTLTLALKHAEAAWNMGRMDELYTCVIEAVGKADRGVQRDVIARLRELDARRGGASELGIGVVPLTAAIDS